MTNSSKQKPAETQNQADLLPEITHYLNVLNYQILPAFIQTGSIANAINAREGLANLTHNLLTEKVDVPLIVDDIIECEASTSDVYDVPVRLFYPSLPAYTDQPEPTSLPIMLYFHGGGGTAGSVAVYHQILCRLAKHTGHIVIAPEYRLAPENPYPCGQNDACSALLGLPKLLARQQISPTNIVVAGDSHGGALVTNLLRDPRVKDSDVIDKISAQVLIYPSVDFTMSGPSIEKYGDGYLLSRQRISWYFDQYFQNNENRKAKSALFATPNELKDQPPALIINAAIDPLYDEGATYANKLTEAGVNTQHITYEQVIHAYLNMENLNPDICQQTYEAIAEFLNNQA
ncbi:alpha/beta hydrolase [Psychrobacter jeotgali]|uniref:alpha/beta hydrolase n=1 Tax=Psychrobacter jeotgali TaxID=179010 RepID=UPI001918FA00|nr:alpha/beta hydrolase [Psychrobacter jeotgali]